MNRYIRTVFYCALILVQIGCARDDEIKRYRVAKQSRFNRSMESKVPVRFVGAIIPHAERTWFLKVTGPDENLQAEMEKFRSFVRSIRFSGDDSARLSWELPNGWEEFPATGIRYATLKFGPVDDPLELSVTALPTPAAKTSDFMLANINRWRQQVGVPPITPEQLPDSVELIPLDATTATIVSFLGRTAGGGRMVPPVEEKGNSTRNPEPPSGMHSVKSRSAEGVPNGK